jgi:hypothetical protein
LDKIFHKRSEQDPDEIQESKQENMNSEADFF